MTEYRKYWNERMETLPSDEYQELQSKALVKELEYVWQNSTFYQEKFNEAGIELNDIKGIENLYKLPFTEKNELRESLASVPPLGKHSATDIANVIRIYSTSGTTGTPTYIGLTNHDRQIWRETANRAMWTCGIRPHHIVPLPIGTFFIAASYGEAIESLGATLVPVGVGATDRLIGACKNLGANYILSTTSFPLYLINYCQKKGIDPKDLGIRGFMLGGEPGAGIPHIRRHIEETLGANVQETMGNGDMLGLMWAECEFKNGIHFIGQGACHPEIIDPDTGEVLEVTKGTKGEMVYTSLDRECQPLIRFRTRDHVEVTQTACECGRTGYCIRCVGRTDDMLIISGVNVYPSAIRDVISSLTPRATGEILIQLQEPPPSVKPPLLIKVEHGEELDDPAQLKSDIEKLLREKLIFSSNVKLVPPGTLPKYEYKAKLVEKNYEM